MSRPSFKNVTCNILSLTVCCLLLIVPLFLPLTASAATGQVSTQGASGEATNSWTNPGNARGATDDDVYATANPAAGGRITGIWDSYGFDSSLPLHAVITKVEVIPQYKLGSMLYDLQLEIQAATNGSLCPPVAFADDSRPTTDTDVVVDITSCRSWVRSDLLNANFSTKIAAYRPSMLLLSAPFSLDYVKVRVTYTTSDYNQVAYRWFDNTDSTAIGTALAGPSSAPTLYAPRDYIRLRLLLKVSLVPLLTSAEQFKLQYAQKSTNCSSETYTDVTTSSSIAFYNNPTPVSNSLLASSAGDPTYANTLSVSQAYNEGNPINTLANVAVNDGGLWDFSLMGNGALANTTYCLRMVKNNGAALTTYSIYPEVTTATTGSLVVDFVDNLGNPVSSPAFNFEPMISPVVCISSLATLGETNQKIRIKNTTDTAGWSVSIAATGGSSALWSADTPKYDFNDGTGSPAGCSAGLDSDTYAGQMTINPSTATLAPRAVSACTTNGISKGSSAAFSEGSLNSISLVTASGSVKTGCFWDMTGIAVSQQIPGGQQPGNYSLDLTVTVLAI